MSFEDELQLHLLSQAPTSSYVHKDESEVRGKLYICFIIFDNFWIMNDNA